MIRVQRSLLIAAAVFANAGIIFGGALVRALTTEQVQPPAKPATVRQPAVQAEPASPVEAPPGDRGKTATRNRTGRRTGSANELDAEDLMLAVDHDPFRVDRQRPDERYRLPGEEIPEEAPPPPPPAPPAMRVLATAVMPTGGLALVQVQDAVHRVLNVGESVIGYTLASVGPGTAVMEGNAGTFTLRVDEPQPNRQRNARNTRAGSTGRAGNVPNREQQRELEARAAQMRDAIEMLRANGGNPQQIRQLIEAMGRELENIRRNQNNNNNNNNNNDSEGWTGYAPLSVQPGRGRVMLRPRPDTLMSKSN